VKAFLVVKVTFDEVNSPYINVGLENRYESITLSNQQGYRKVTNKTTSMGIDT
jgi:hypothetical protein